jgi:hypothetical protein
MSDKNYQDLLDEAKELGLAFKGRISKEKLITLIDEHKMNQTIGDSEEATENLGDEQVKVSTREQPAKSIPQLVKEAKKRAFSKRVVTLTSNDKRDNDIVTTEPLMFENQYFSLSRIVPLDVPAELEQCLIDIAKECTIILHVDEVVNGKRTGNKMPKHVKKFTVSYGENQ